MTKVEKAAKLREEADRYEAAVSSQAGPSSQEWISPERFDHYMEMANKKRVEAERLAPAVSPIKKADAAQGGVHREKDGSLTYDNVPRIGESAHKIKDD